jgi:RNA-directed DNA polymerase
MIIKLESLAMRLRFEDTESLVELCASATNYYKTKIDFKQKDGKWKVRILTPSKGLLKKVQKRINRMLRDVPLPHYVHGARRKHSSITNARVHQGNNEFFVTDLKNFFPSISHLRVYNAFIAAGFSPDVSSALTRLTTYRGILPQGTPTSSAIANLCFIPTGERLFNLAKSFSGKYSQYVDDLTFSAAREFKTFTPRVIQIIASAGFKVSRKKTGYKRGPISVTGAIARNNNLAIPQNIYDRLADPTITEDTRKGLLLYKAQIENA